MVTISVLTTRPLLRSFTFHLLFSLAVVVRGEEIMSTNSTGNDDDDGAYKFDGDDVPMAEVRTMAYLAKPFALISIICSYVMIREVIADQRSNCGTPITRTLFSVAVADILFSFATFLGMWPIPSANDDAWLIGNVGNQGWCTFQGFIWIFGNLASCFFSASLSILYLLMVRYNWSTAKLRKLEPWQQGSIWITALAVALYPIPLKMYNSLGDKCAVGCYGDECVYVSDEFPHVLAFALVPWPCLFISLVAMSLLLCTVRRLEDKTKKYASSLVVSSDLHQKAKRRNVQEQERQVNRKKSTAVAMQGICYATAFLMTYLLDLISTIWWIANGGGNPVLDHFAWGILMPSAGTFNFLVFARTRTAMKTPEGNFLRGVMCCSCCPSWPQRVPPPEKSAVDTEATAQAPSSIADPSSAMATETANKQGGVDAFTTSRIEI